MKATGKGAMLYLVMALGMTTGCSDEFEAVVRDNASGRNVPESVEEAVRVAELSVFDGTRGNHEVPEITAILCGGKTRSSENGLASDTAAFIVNYPESRRFAIVANDNRVSEPLLAFSKTNEFSTNKSVEDNFISKIPDYLSSVVRPGGVNDTVQPSRPISDERCGPYMSMVMNSCQPYNYYVSQDPEAKEMGGWWQPVGCVPLAAINIISHTEKTLTRYGRTYDFVNIRKAINEGEGRISPTSDNPYTYKTATDAMAWLLYKFGKEIKANYTYYIGENGEKQWNTEARFDSAFSAMKKIGCDMPDIYHRYDKEYVKECLRNRYMFFVIGCDFNNRGWHAWVIDGFYTIKRWVLSGTIGGENTYVLDTYVHCDWGWGEDSVGYYLSEIVGYNIGKLADYRVNSISPVRIKY